MTDIQDGYHASNTDQRPERRLNTVFQPRSYAPVVGLQPVATVGGQIQPLPLDLTEKQRLRFLRVRLCCSRPIVLQNLPIAPASSCRVWRNKYRRAFAQSPDAD